MQRFYIQRNIGGAWENWSMGDDEQTPDSYASFDDALAALKDCIKDQIESVEAGRIDDSEDPANFRIVTCREVYEYKGGMDYVLSDDPLAFIDYWRLIDDEMRNHFGIDTSDAGLDADYIADLQESGETPEHFAKWYGVKYDLIPRKIKE